MLLPGHADLPKTLTEPAKAPAQVERSLEANDLEAEVLEAREHLRRCCVLGEATT
jgi:hypothetical protein